MPDSTLNRDLSECDREPIQTSGAIQPHGFLLGFDAALQILVVSDNVHEHRDAHSSPIHGNLLSSVLDTSSLELVRAAMARPNPRGADTLRLKADSKDFDAHLSRSGSLFLLEFEPVLSESPPESDLLTWVERLGASSSLDELMSTAVREIKNVSGFDRVMIYRFDSTGAGEVIAEQVEPGMEPYLRLHYPATDIPMQARRLYMLNWVRIIADMNYRPARLVPELNPLDGQPIDLSFVGLRSVSPIHREYMRNMGGEAGIVATMSLSLISGNRLWGLIACHHRERRLVPPSTRRICELAARVFSSQIPSLERATESAARLRSAFVGVEVVEAMSTEPTFTDGLRRIAPMMRSLVVADGCAAVFDDTWVLEGHTPSVEAMKTLASWIATRETEAAYNTNKLSAQYPEGVAIKDVASGVLAASFAQAHGMLLWFRQEVIDTVSWAGDPALAIEGEGNKRLSPRKSFAAWKQTVEFTSRPWAEWEIAAATRLRDAMTNLWVRREAEAQLNIQLTRDVRTRDSYLASAAHELRNSIMTLQLQVQLLRRVATEPTTGAVSAAALTPRIESTQKQIKRLNELVDELLDVSRLTERPLQLQPCDLREQVDECVKTFEAQLAESGSSIAIDSAGDTNGIWDRLRIDQVLTNILSNAIKYGAGKPIAIRIEGDQDWLCLTVVDHGIGIDSSSIDRLFEAYARGTGVKNVPGLGLGLWITRQLVLRLGGTINVTSELGRGSEFVLRIPRVVKDCAEATR